MTADLAYVGSLSARAIRWRRPGAAGTVGGVILRWLAALVPVLVITSVVTFGLGVLSNANPAATILGDEATPQSLQRLENELGLDRPFLVQYLAWIGNAFQGDLGSSYFTQIPVSDSIAQRLPVDLSLAIVGGTLALVVGALLGMVAALRRGGLADRMVMLFASIGNVVPPFVVGIVLIIVLATSPAIFPSGGYVPLADDPYQWLLHMTLPALAVSLDLTASVARQLRMAMVLELQQNYVTGARMRGLSERRVVLVHVLRNSAGPALTVFAAGLPVLIGGAVLVEMVFALPGLGQLAINSASQRDVPVVQGVLLVTSTIVVALNTLVNALNSALRPTTTRY